MLHDNEMTRQPALDEAVMSGMLEVVSDGLWDWNANTGYVHRYPGWYQMLGYEPLPRQHRLHLGEPDPPGRSGAGHGELRCLPERAGGGLPGRIPLPLP